MIKQKELLTSAIYGAIDLGVEKMDSGAALFGPVTATDAERTIAFLGSLAASKMSRSEKTRAYADTVAISSLPLLEKSVYKWVKNWVPQLPRSDHRLVLRSYEGQTLPPPPQGSIRTSLF